MDQARGLSDRFMFLFPTCLCPSNEMETARSWFQRDDVHLKQVSDIFLEMCIAQPQPDPTTPFRTSDADIAKRWLYPRGQFSDTERQSSGRVFCSYSDVGFLFQAITCIMISPMTFVARDCIGRAVYSSVVRRCTEFALDFLPPILCLLSFHCWWCFLYCLNATSLTCWRVEDFLLFLGLLRDSTKVDRLLKWEVRFTEKSLAQFRIVNAYHNFSN